MDHPRVVLGLSYITGSLLITTITLAFIFYWYVTRKLNYWTERNVVGPRPLPLIGNLSDVLTLKSAFSSFLRDIYNSYGEPFVGFFTFGEPALLIRDPKIIKEILGQDFNYFQDRLMHQPKHNKVFANVLFAMKNPKWKTTRTKLTPAFSSSKIKDLFHGVKQVCDDMVRYMKSNTAEQESACLFKKFSTEVTTRTMFGVKGECFDREDSEFLKYSRAMFGFSLRNGICQSIYFFKGYLVDIFKVEFFARDVEGFFKDVFWKCMKNVEGMETKPHNFITLLEELRRNDPYFDDNLLESQGLMFFAAGTETVAAAIYFVLYELALNPSIQDKVRKEIRHIIDTKGLDFESLKEMNYLEMCIKESMRKYPSLPFLDRKCTADYKIPGTNLIIEKDTPVYISLLGIQRDEKYFPEPEKFIPERFKIDVNEPHFAYAPFGSGQRACIGVRFGMMSCKLALVHVLTNFSVETTSETPTHIEIDPKCIPLAAKGGIPLKFNAL